MVQDSAVTDAVLEAMFPNFTNKFSVNLQYNSPTKAYVDSLCKRSGIGGFKYSKKADTKDIEISAVRFNTRKDYLVFALRWLK